MMQDGPTKTAVLQVCDANFLPFALHLMNQIIHFCPYRTFDLVIASEEPLTLPQWARDAGVLFHRMGADDLPQNLPVGQFVRASFYRIRAPDQFADRYRRILYLDGDILMDGGDLERLINIPMGDHPIAAVIAPMVYRRADGMAPEYKILGMPRLPYFNTGVMVIDTAAYVSQRIADRSIEVIETKREAILFADQSALNVVLAGKFAVLSPVWNWMQNKEFPYLTRRQPVRFHHFIGKTKPWNDVEHLDLRFRESYANFFRTYMPEAMSKLAATAAPRTLPLGRLTTDLLVHTQKRAINAERFSSFRDEWDVKL